MILILTDIDEPSTDFVIDWLQYYRKPFTRLSIQNSVEITKIYQHRGRMECVFNFIQQGRTATLDTKDISSYWYRRSQWRVRYDTVAMADEAKGDAALNDFLQVENLSALGILEHILDHKKHINRHSDNNIIKLVVLQYATELGIRVPAFVVCSDKASLVDFYNKYNGDIITKPIGDPRSFFHYGFHTFTSRIDLDGIPDRFGISLFQEMIKKKVELRIYYLQGRFYGSAIFSQSNEQTKVDFKNYSNTRPNRVVPFELPGAVQQQLDALMQRLDINSGSIDMVLTPEGEYVFLEVNPVGQFEQVSVPCHYNLFKTIAETL
jgi:ATP-GRASP peptide maturase of grasp-with-spasm system